MAATTKNIIRDRMVNTAARIWEIDEHEIEQNIDPLALLLIEACSAEMEKIEFRIEESHSRLLDNLSEIILPESLFGAIPASGVLQAQPLEESVFIDEKTSFSLTEKLHRPAKNSYDNVDIYFSPVGKMKLINTELSYMLAGNKLYSIKRNNKELLYTGNDDASSNSFWLCLSAGTGTLDLQGLSIYFDLRNHANANSFYNALEYASCKINGKEASLKPGVDLYNENRTNQNDIIESGDDRSKKLDRKTSFIYSNRFVQVTDKISVSGGPLPEELKNMLDADLSLKLSAENLVCIQVNLPQFFDKDILNAITCHINAFPVVNKQFHSFSYQTDQYINIVPIPQGATFFDLAGVKNEKGENYKSRPGAGANSVAAGEVVVRTAGIGHTSSEDVRSMINNISETIRDQSAYFGQVSNAIVLGKLREIGKSLTGLEDAIGKSIEHKPAVYYLILRPKQNGDLIFIDYWTTQAEDANQIKAFKPINKVNNGQVNAKLSSTLTSFSGGQIITSAAEKKVVLRQEILSGGKIISAGDIQLLCKKIYGDKLNKVEVSKGVRVGVGLQEGFQKTIDISLTFTKKLTPEMHNEKANLSQELAYYLQKDASPVYPFNIIEEN